MEHYLEFKSITKTFPGVRALDKVSFTVKSSSIHGLVGENGAGKSTLLHTLSGALIPNEGKIIINGKAMKFSSTKDALDAGIAVIYQELNLVPEMTVAENLMIGNFPNHSGLVDHKKLRKQAEKQIKRLMEEFNPDTKVKNLSIAQKQMIEIGKALMQDAQIIAFDEPTSSLSDREIKHLFTIIEQLKAEGRAIIYVSHRMEEIFKICDTCTVFRDGKHIETFTDMEKVSHDLLVKKMVGRELNDVYGYESRPAGEVIFSVKNLQGPGVNKPISLKLKAGEVIGIFGLVGAGRTELFKLIYGLEELEKGEIEVQGEKLAIKNPHYSIKNKICLLPEDRKEEGIIGIRSVSENINVSSRRHTLKFNFFLDKDAERKIADKFINELAIKTPSREQLTGNLSGGNQQKVILSRWLSEDIDIFLMDEPTRGIDVGAKYEIYKIMYQLAASGKGIIFISSDLPEVMGVADRIIVMRTGEIVGSLSREAATEEKILSMALPVN
ncbi:L-arabinose ABC transporter ATP-binding protein AraG [Halanaerobium salsuginis]|uniref:L-arabinose ABC transporter ATP-binding protein n=1 Tax=Halanaerobium salsuginis TaxID=29563 RepID=A0A1I4HGT3_9FIRM|nr:L-arabinose ABC transporter ATP-binding protein AraG [Halanaerobium salsuginis]SFL40731.1 L-arabinose ABC transporter ATP-binding protein [Halanaerobium salsuginis]